MKRNIIERAGKMIKNVFNGKNSFEDVLLRLKK